MYDKAYFSHFQDLFLDNGNPEIAEKQMQYMRNQFEFYGIKSPLWKTLTKNERQQNGLPSVDEVIPFCRWCMDDEHRELHYLAVDLLERTLKKQPSECIDFLEEMITTNSWWDTVDWIANKLVGKHFIKYPELILPYTQKWIHSDNFWLQRTAIIFQLKYKGNTNKELLAKYILIRQDSQEFFIQKAMGWALREYAKTNPEWVAQFIMDHPQLPALTKREGGRLLNNTNLTTK